MIIIVFGVISFVLEVAEKLIRDWINWRVENEVNYKEMEMYGDIGKEKV